MKFSGSAANASGLLLTGEETAEHVLSLYHRYGEDAFRRLDGGFALALADRETGRLYLARDRFGAVPLYYYPAEEFSFSTDLDELKKLPGFDRKALNPDAVADFLALQYISGRKTIYRHTFKLLPGQTLCYDLSAGTYTLHDWNDLNVPAEQQTALSYADACAALRDRLTDAVRKRLASGTGTFLSGGLDSAILTAIAAQETGNSLPVYSMGNPDPAYDESALASETAAYLGLTGQHTIIPFTIPAVAELPIPAEPFADASLIPFSRLCNQAALCTSVLSGDGADELFLGYDRYRAMKMLSHLPPGLCRLAASLLPEGGERTLTGRLKRLFSTGVHSSDPARYFAMISHDAEKRMTGLLRFEYKQMNPEISGNLFDLKYYLPDDGMTKTRLGTVNTRLRLLTPFTDRAVADLALRLPEQFKLKGKCRKRILGDAFAGLLPPGIAQRKKRGFGVPVAEWMRGCWKNSLYEHLLSSAAADWFVPATTERLLQEHCSRKADHAYLLYSMLIFMLWLERN